MQNLEKTLSERKVLKAAEPPKDCRRKAEKGFNWIVRGCLLCALIRGLENLEKFQKDLIVAVRSCGCGELIRGWQNLESPCEGTDLFFLRRAKSNIKSTRDSVLRPRFKALPEKILTEVSDGTSRTRLFARNGGEKALNRCDVPALQRKDLERRLKEQLYSFVDSRLWLGKKGRRRAKKNSLFSLCKADQ